MEAFWHVSLVRKAKCDFITHRTRLILSQKMDHRRHVNQYGQVCLTTQLKLPCTLPPEWFWCGVFSSCIKKEFEFILNESTENYYFLKGRDWIVSL